MSNKYIKQCGLCQKQFTAEQLISDPELQIIGMSYDYKNGTAYYFYQHNTPNCGTSFILDSRLLMEYIEEEIPDDLLYQSNDCKHRCVHLKDLQNCENECSNAPYRRFLLHMIEQKKKAKRTQKVH